MYIGRFSLFIEVLCFVEYVGGARVLLKREDFNYIGLYKINNVFG